MNDIPSFRFDSLLPTDKTKFHRYNGSLTIPTCNEAVTWTVFKDAVEMSQARVKYTAVIACYHCCCCQCFLLLSLLLPRCSHFSRR